MKRALFVFHPKSGTARLKPHLLYIIDTLTKGGYRVTACPTQYAGHARELVLEGAADCDLLVVAGGDGTLNEAVDALMHLPREQRPLLGYIPSGTVNDFASGRGIPKNMGRAADAIIGGREFVCDVGRFGSRHFTYVAAFGAFSRVSYDTPQKEKNALGLLAYLLEGIRSLSEIRPYRLTVEHDGKTVQGNFIFGLVANSTSVGSFQLSRKIDVSLNDGLFEVLLIREPRDTSEEGRILAGVLAQDFSDPLFYWAKTAALRVRSASPLAWSLDGENGGKTLDVSIENLHEALRLMTDKNARVFLPKGK